MLLMVSAACFAQSPMTDSARKAGLAAGGEVSYVLPTRYELGGINVTGDAYDRNLVTAFSGLSIGQRITIPGDEITQALQNLWKQGLFSDIKFTLDKIDGDKVYLGVYLRTRPKLSSYQFKDVSKGTAKKLKEQVRLAGGNIVTEQLIANARYNIREYYIKKGYPNATATVTQKVDSGRANTVKLVFDVKRGSKVKIQSITFTGNKEFDEKKLRHTLKQTKVKNFFNIFKASRFQPDNYDDDKKKLLAYYQVHGFKDARIVSDSVYKVSDSRLAIKINVDEGHKYYFRNITWAGNTKYTSQQLDGVLNIHKGDLYNPGLLESRLTINPTALDVTSLYMDDGYLFFTLNPVETRADQDSIDLEIRISEGPQATVNHVTVTGNTKTHDHVILRELRTRPGQKFSRSDIIRSQRELSQLGYFNPEKMNVIPTPNPKDGTVDIQYIVEEKPNDQIELSGGYGANSLVGVLGLSLNNFSARNFFKPDKWQGYPSGDGQRLSMRIQTNGKYYQLYNMSFTEPWFGGKRPTSLSVSPFYSVQTNGLPSYDPSSYAISIAGLSIGLGRRLKIPDDYFTLTNTLSYQYYTLTNYTLIPNFKTGNANNLYFKHTISHSTVTGLDGNTVYLNNGSTISFTFQWTPPWSLFSNKDYSTLPASKKYNLIEYHKWKFDAVYYLGLDRKKKLVVMAASNFGLIGLYNRQLGLAPFERFYVGGDGLQGYSIDGRELIRLRGYSNSAAVTPSETRIDGTPESAGATIYNRFTFEMRYPITTSQAATIYTLGFLEAGNAFQRFKNYNPFDVKRAAGVGIRVFLPMFGLLGFDWGYGFDNPLPGGKSGWNFHIYIGQQSF